MGEWCDLCELWGGVWHLRLVVKGSVFAQGKTAMGTTGRMLNASGTGFVGAEGTNGLPDTVVTETQNATEAKPTILDVNRQWIQHGLLRLGSLRKLEFEIVDDDVPHDTRAKFCAELGAAL